MADRGEQVEVSTEREPETAAVEPSSVIVHRDGRADPNATRDYMNIRGRGRYRAYRTPEELVDFPRDDDGIIRFEDMQINNPRAVPTRLAGISHVCQHCRFHRYGGLSARHGSVWNQVHAALEDERREDILEKVSTVLLCDIVHTYYTR